jgi:pimeloyl-ACP methyl ester carboxylesterase
MVAAVNASAATAAGQSADGELIDVGSGRRMYLECHGQGGPTVVFESGYPNDGTVWSLNGVFEAVAGSTRACVYDRPGTLVEEHLSRSDAAPQPRTALDVVTDLHALLQAAGEPGPYVFVAHSIGGLFVRLYASTYPDEVAGMVLVDTSSGIKSTGSSRSRRPSWSTPSSSPRRTRPPTPLPPTRRSSAS